MADYARGQRLRELRERKHESQENVAYAVGVSVKTIRSWEHGGKIRWPNAKRLGSFYSVDPESLVSREAPDEPAESDVALTQLDHIDKKVTVLSKQVSEIRSALLGDGQDGEVVAGIAVRLLQAAGLLQSSAGEPPESAPGDQPPPVA